MNKGWLWCKGWAKEGIHGKTWHAKNLGWEGIRRLLQIKQLQKNLARWGRNQKGGGGGGKGCEKPYLGEYALERGRNSIQGERSKTPGKEVQIPNGTREGVGKRVIIGGAKGNEGGRRRP